MRAIRVVPLSLTAMIACSPGLAPAATSELGGGAPSWYSGGHPTQQTLSLAYELRHAEERGLRSSDYQTAAPSSPQDDAAFGSAVARFVTDLHLGRVKPADVGFDLEMSRPAFDVAAVLRSLAATSSVKAALDELEPQFLHYALLKQALARYRQLTLRPELNLLPDPGKTSIKPGAMYVGAPQLRRLLVALGDMPDARTEQQDFRLDPELVAGLKAFQNRHGLTEDGALGRDTYSALTTPFAQRVRQIELSLERWRWLPSRLQAPVIIVNIPQFRLFALRSSTDSEQEMLRMNVVVGKAFRELQTPIFAADLRYIVLHPYWDVPYSIVKKELLPSILTDTGYITRNGYEIVRGQTDDAEVQQVTAQTVAGLTHGALRLRQKPGPKNPLGFVKFMLPNPYNVYLHSTSAPALFGGAQRAFSHGCVRVADPMSLLNYVLSDNSAADKARIAQLLEQPGPHRLNLRTPVRVYIVYTTALAREDGRTLFFKDIYGHDAPLQKLLDARSRH
jgi:L,D-transpeptidase YcbB